MHTGMRGKEPILLKKGVGSLLFVCGPSEGLRTYKQETHIFFMDSRSFQLVRLSDSQREYPQETLKRLFAHLTLQEVRSVFNYLTHLMVADDDDDSDASKADILFCLERLEEMAEANYLLYGKEIGENLMKKESKA